MIKKLMTLAAIFMLCVMGTQAQVLKGADLELYGEHGTRMDKDVRTPLIRPDT